MLSVVGGLNDEASSCEGRAWLVNFNPLNCGAKNLWRGGQTSTVDDAVEQVQTQGALESLDDEPFVQRLRTTATRRPYAVDT